MALAPHKPQDSGTPTPSARLTGPRAWTLNLLSSLALAAVVGGLLTMGGRSGPVPGEIPDHKEALQAELTNLNENLEKLRQGLGETRGMESQTRSLVGLRPKATLTPPPLFGRRFDLSGIADPELAAVLESSSLQAEESLREARALKQSFREIVSSMEVQGDLWARVPSVDPILHARVTSGFGLRADPFTGAPTWHEGMDIGAPVGTPVRATAGGTVTRAGYYTGYGYLVEVDHGNGLVTRYGHNSRNAVRPGDVVTRGQLLAFSGQSGRANAPHLHYEVRVHGRPVNPEPYLLSGFLKHGSDLALNPR